MLATGNSLSLQKTAEARVTALSVPEVQKNCRNDRSTPQGKDHGFRRKSLPCLVLETGLEPALP